MRIRCAMFLVGLVMTTFFFIPYIHADHSLENKIHVLDEAWTLRKNLNAEGETKSVDYISPDNTVSNEEGFKQAIRLKLESLKIEPSLLKRIRLIPPETPVPVIISLKDQPYAAVREQIEGQHRLQREALQYQIDLSRKSHDEETAKAILEENRLIIHRVNAEAYMKSKETVESQQMALASEIEFLGGKVNYGYTIINALSATIPAKEIEQLSARPGIAEISEDKRMEANLNVSIPSIYADTWWNNGYTGGTYNAAIVDSGMDTSHPAFSGKIFVNGTFHGTGSTDPCYDDTPASTDDFFGHGTHVGGIVMSQGAAGSPPPPGDPGCIDCKGVARGLNKTFNLKAAWREKSGGSCSGSASMYFSDAMAAVDWAESQPNPPDVYNLSYGGSTSSDDSSFARFWDAIVSMNGKPVALSAGNSGPSNTNFNDPAVSYNAVTVANINDFNTTNRSDDKIANSSTRGPTLSGRKKPDLAAPGTFISSTNAFWEVDYDFVDYTGTSMAAPHIAGSFILLQNYLGSGIAASLREKALLINTADAWSDKGTVGDPSDDGPVAGKHWDQTYGWGYVNLGQAYIQREGTYSDSLSTVNTYRLYKGHLNAGDKATVAWNRRVLYNQADYPATWYTLSDIDLYVRRESDNLLLDSSQSGIDNVEQVASPSSENVVIKVKLQSSIDGAASELYGLATEGSFTLSSFDVRFQNGAPPIVCPNRTFNYVQPLMNFGDVYSHNQSTSLSTPPGWVQSTVNPQTLDFLQPNRKGVVSWSLTSPASGAGSFSISGTSDSYGEIVTIPTTLFSIGIKSPAFTDVPCDHPFYGWIERMTEKGITAGCSPTLYCPGNPVTRKETAVFIITAAGQAPSPAPYNAYFADVANDGFAPYINRMYELHITGGCGPGAYCPDQPVTRGQMAVFISAAKGWAPFSPTSPTFADVPSSYPFYGYIERLWRNGITSGCSSTQYCPGANISRGQMAVFVTTAWP